MPGILKSYKAAIIWAAFVLVLCLLPGEELPDIDFWEINIEDKLAHVGVFGILAALITWGRHYRFPHMKIGRNHALIIMASTALYGIFTESLQHFVTTTRYASISDFIADALGAIAGGLGAAWYFNNYGPHFKKDNSTAG